MDAESSHGDSLCDNDESMLNGNLRLSTIMELSSLSPADGVVSMNTTSKLSITLTDQERELLRKYHMQEPSKRNELKSLSVNEETLPSSMHLEDTKNETIVTDDETLNEQTCTTVEISHTKIQESSQRNGTGHALNNSEDKTVEKMHETVKAVDISSSQMELEESQAGETTAKQVEITSNDIDTDIDSYERNYFQSRLIELGRRCWPSTHVVQHYTKGCLWSPDGTCLLVPVHMDGMHVMELPLDLYEAPSVDENREVSPMKSAVHIPEGGTVYDCVWYPHMNSAQPETCFWLATRQHEPIHMWDAFDGKLRCTYSGYDAVDEVETAISLSFSNDGQKIYAGYKRTIKIFDTSRPGRIYDTFPIKHAIACIAPSTFNDQTLTCGNWHGYIQHYDLRSPQLGALITLGGHSGGITHLRYAGDDSRYLLSGARKDNKLLQWDMRNYEKPVAVFDRTVSTNQRIYFDLSPQQEWLISGDTDGELLLWQWRSGTLAPATGEQIKTPLHKDCLNGVNFHPMRPILATSSGQYHFFSEDAKTANKSKDCSDDDDEIEQSTSHERLIDYENALLLLWFGNGT